MYTSDLFISTTESLKPNNLGKNIYLGIGICSRSSLSLAIPFDIISLILCAESFRRKINAEKVFYIIADTHSLLTGHEPQKVLPYTLNLSYFLDGIFKEWSIPHIGLISSFINDIDYSNAWNANGNKKYMCAELTDMYYFIEKYNVGYKLGWKYNNSLSRSKIPVGFDEWHFDKQARKMNIPLDYCYIKSGHTMSTTTSMVSPYICLDLKNRILFKDIQLKEKLTALLGSHELSARRYKQYITQIQLLYCALFSKPIKGTLPFVLSMSKRLS
ncbi:hypothetical protein [Legionella fallonii]|uniref:Uncharacterized protein n=1 Tax=Legionella fallonii LLAP-10 TaxID=1212491 RepID=A0A098FZP7_9GAMM|nr:hypothetical protein [Legionella fallonii]CEG55708.1 protein of unknown function [Legionella fallonii LLAP-10]